MLPDQLSRIEKSIIIEAPRSRVWQALTDIKEFGSWFGVNTEGSFAPGARVEMTPNSGDYGFETFVVYVERMEAERFFSWRWQPGAYEPETNYYREPLTLVEFHLDDVNEGTRLRVIESGFDLISLQRRAKVLAENTGGWEEQLNAIAKYVRQPV